MKPDQHHELELASAAANLIQSPLSMNEANPDEPQRRSQAATAHCRIAEFSSAAGWA